MVNEDRFIQPLSHEIIILDDPDYTVENGIVVPTPVRRNNLDFWIVRGQGDGYGTGDKIVLDDPLVGRKIKIDNVGYRVVPKDHVVAVVDNS